MCNARRCLTCHHISCKSTITSSINGNRYGIEIDKDVDWNSSNLIYVITWEARGCGAQYVGETSQSLKGRFRSHSFKIRNNSRRKYKNFLYDHFIKYNHSIENVTITPVEILSKQPGDSKNDMKKRRLSAELNWIKRLQTPYPLGLNDQIYQQGNISSVRSNINVFSLKPDVRRKRRSHGVRRNGLSRRKQRLNRSLDDLCESRKITVDMSFYMHSLLFQCLDWNQSWMRLTAEVYDIQIDSNLKWLWPFRLINSFHAYQHFLLKHSLSKLSSFIKAWTCSIFPTFSEIIESPLKFLSISRILNLLLFAISIKILLEISFSTTTK